MPEVGGEVEQVALDIGAAAIPSQQRVHCESMAKVMQAWTVGVGWPRRLIWRDNFTNVQRRAHSVTRVPRSERKKLGLWGLGHTRSRCVA